MEASKQPHLVALDLDVPIWERVFTVAPLIIVGTREEDGRFDLAPKHMAMPMGWDNYLGFMCTPRHRTYQNIRREEVFTVSYPLPSQVVLTSLTASPRCEDDTKPFLASMPTFPAKKINGCFIREAYLFLECRMHRIIDGFGPNSLIVGSVVAAQAREEAVRHADDDEHDAIGRQPLLAYLAPGRYAEIKESFAFPFPQGIRY